MPARNRGLLDPDLDDLAGLDDMGFGLATVATERQHVLGDLAAQFLEC
jgi:hypothetical protein